MPVNTRQASEQSIAPDRATPRTTNNQTTVRQLVADFEARAVTTEQDLHSSARQRGVISA